MYEITLPHKEVVQHTGGHGGEVWGLACHPTENIVFTCGDDKLLRGWSTETKKPLPDKSLGLPHPARSLSWSHDALTLVIGFLDGPKAASKFAPRQIPVWVVDYETMKVTATLDDAGEYVAAVAFSPDGAYLATGSWDQQVRDDTVAQNYKLLWTLAGNSSSVEHLGWSADGDVLMSNSKDGQILYWEIATGARINKQALLRDVRWVQWQCVLGWPVMGIWDPGYDQTDINAVCQSHKGDALALGDDYGQVKLFRFPIPVDFCAACVALRGHSSHVTNIRWLHDDSRVLSTGGADTALFQWRYLYNTPPDPAAVLPAEVRNASLKQRSKSPGKKTAAGPKGGGKKTGARMVTSRVTCAVLGVDDRPTEKKNTGKRPGKVGLNPNTSLFPSTLQAVA